MIRFIQFRRGLKHQTQLHGLDPVSRGFFKAGGDRIVIGGLDERGQWGGWDIDCPWALQHRCRGGWLQNSEVFDGGQPLLAAEQYWFCSQACSGPVELLGRM